VEIIDVDQTTFLPLIFILDIVLLAQETIDWAKHLKININQPLV
jgi:hypothetical protein